MPAEALTAAHATPPLLVDLGSFERSLLAANMADQTVRTYAKAVEGLTRYVLSTVMPSNARDLRREHIDQPPAVWTLVTGSSYAQEALRTCADSSPLVGSTEQQRPAMVPS